MAEEYTRARKKGLKTYNKQIAAGRYPYLPALEYMIPNIGSLSREYVGTMEIPAQLIAGTFYIARQNAFSADFMPLMEMGTEFSDKWSSLFDVQQKEGIRDAVKVVEYMRRFYVIEGNKRVSVMRFLEMPVVLADVERILPQKSDDPEEQMEVQMYFEFLEFYRAVPMYDVEITKPGGYRFLAQMWGRDLDVPWPQEEVRDFQSAVNLFAEAYQNLTEPKPEMTLGDALLWYALIYPLQSLRDESPEKVTEKVERIRKELLTESNDEGMFLIESADYDNRSTLDKLSGKLFKKHDYSSEHPLKIAFLYDRDIGSSSWNYVHELGRTELGETFGDLVQTTRYEHCESDQVFRQSVALAMQEGAEIVVSTSPRQIDEALRSAIRYPEMHFLNCSVNLSRHAVRTYYARMYEAKFLMGMLAGCITEDHRIGYRADYPIYGTIANINAFAIGAAMTDPKAKIHLKWSTLKDRNWFREMQEEGIRVISGKDSIRPDSENRAYGLYYLNEEGKIRNLAAPVWHWSRFYEALVRNAVDGIWDINVKVKEDQSVTYWWGMESGVIDILLSDHLSPYTRRLVETAKQGLLHGLVKPFEGEIKSQNGIIRRIDDPPLAGKEIILMDWLNENVVGEIPPIDSLTEWAQETVRVNGVMREEGTDEHPGSF